MTATNAAATATVKRRNSLLARISYMAHSCSASQRILWQLGCETRSRGGDRQIPGHCRGRVVVIAHMVALTQKQNLGFTHQPVCALATFILVIAYGIGFSYGGCPGCVVYKSQDHLLLSV